jgi:Family of unknown function (DUF6153)
MPRWATIGLLGTLLLSVLAMHGLGSHYVIGAGHGEIGLAAASTPDMSSTDRVSQTDPCKAPACHKGRHDASTGLLILCTAVLVGIAVLLILALVATRHSALSRWTRIHQRIRTTGIGGPDPPTLYQLSLLRC